ncbi:hypothetical protein LZ30DRAFT_296979 [Colletotrichum cereale]|nr:hypothetical protein LZ30DRAFT_296979 [Colletotrichum cereale]
MRKNHLPKFMTPQRPNDGEETWRRVLRKRQKQIEKEERAARKPAEQERSQRQQQSSSHHLTAGDTDDKKNKHACGSNSSTTTSPSRPRQLVTALWAVLVDIASTVGRLFTVFCITCVFCSLTIYGTETGDAFKTEATARTQARATATMTGAVTATAVTIATPLALFPRGEGIRRDLDYLWAVHPGRNDHSSLQQHDPSLRLIDCVLRTPTWSQHWTSLSDTAADITAHGKSHTAQLLVLAQRGVDTVTALQRDMLDNPAAVLWIKVYRDGGAHLDLGWAPPGALWAFFSEVPDRIRCELGSRSDKGCGHVQRTVPLRIDAFHAIVVDTIASAQSSQTLRVKLVRLSSRGRYSFMSSALSKGC